MPTGLEDVPTMTLLDYVYDCEFSNRQNAYDELKAREIKENDADDSTQHRGGIRPGHSPLVG
jgi:hypothetical protein